MEEMTRENNQPVRRYRPALSLYKANPKGTGCALKLELHPAHDQTDGSLMAKIANQATIGDMKGPNPTYPRYDWENAISVKLDFTDLSRMLQVFRGECEELGEGKGIFHRSPSGLTHIGLKHLVEPIPGYSFTVSRVMPGGRDGPRAHIHIMPDEALGLTVAIEQSLGVICFGIPMVIERDVTGYRKAVKEMRNAPAA